MAETRLANAKYSSNAPICDPEFGTVWLKGQAMRLESKSTHHLIYHDPNFLAVAHWIDVIADAGLDVEPTEPQQFIVGRFLAHELPMSLIQESQLNPWDVADADSCELEAAWACLLDDRGRFRSGEFGEPDPIVCLHQFGLHGDFVDWRMAVLDGFCRIFGPEALILIPYDLDWLSDTEFGELGFNLLPLTVFPAPPLPGIDRETQFTARDNSGSDFAITRYPNEAPDGEAKHQTWLDDQGPWEFPV